MRLFKVAILMAMDQEAEPVIESLNLHRSEGGFSAGIPFQWYQGIQSQLEIFLMTAGRDPINGVDNVATQPATLMAYLAVEKLKPAIVVNAGTAGGFQEVGYQIGDVVLSNGGLYFHDRRIPIPGYDQYGMGGYSTFDTTGIAQALGLKTGRISTGNSLDHTDKDLEIIRANQGTVKDMEAAAIAWVCQVMDVPMFAVKAITDLIDDGAATEAQFVENLNLATRHLQQSLKDILNILPDYLG